MLAERLGYCGISRRGGQPLPLVLLVVGLPVAGSRPGAAGCSRRPPARACPGTTPSRPSRARPCPRCRARRVNASRQADPCSRGLELEGEAVVAPGEGEPLAAGAPRAPRRSSPDSGPRAKWNSIGAPAASAVELDRGRKPLLELPRVGDRLPDRVDRVRERALEAHHRRARRPGRSWPVVCVIARASFRVGCVEMASQGVEPLLPEPRGRAPARRRARPAGRARSRTRAAARRRGRGPARPRAARAGASRSPAASRPSAATSSPTARGPLEQHRQRGAAVGIGEGCPGGCHLR